VPLPTTRQLLTPADLQQFVDVSLASTVVGTFLPGWTDRNRDYGVQLRGTAPRVAGLSYVLSVTNGDGPPRRNVLDGSTDDDLDYGARIDWAVLGDDAGYREGSPAGGTFGWEVSAGAWVNAYADVAFDKPHTRFADRSAWGVDAAVRRGAWSFTGAYSQVHFEGNGGTVSTDDFDVDAWLLQAGYRLPGGLLEVAARVDGYHVQPKTVPHGYGAVEEGFAVICRLDEDAEKVSLDASLLQPTDEGNFQADVYSGYSVTGSSHALLLRLQWQLRL
jgi:hypothetical protein